MQTAFWQGGGEGQSDAASVHLMQLPSEQWGAVEGQPEVLLSSIVVPHVSFSQVAAWQAGAGHSLESLHPVHCPLSSGVHSHMLPVYTSSHPPEQGFVQFQLFPVYWTWQATGQPV